MATADFFSRGISYLLMVLFRGIGRVPLQWLSVLAWPFEILAAIFAKKEGRILDRNLDLILGLPPHAAIAKSFRRQVIRSQITVALETLKGVACPDSLLFDGVDELKATMTRLEAQGKGQIMVSGHLGSWELIAMKSAQLAQSKYFALAKPSQYPSVTKVLDWHRIRMGIHVLWTDQKTILRQMLKVLQDRAWLSFVMDQKPQNRQGPDVSFFGRKIAFVGGPATMSLRTGAPILAVFCVRTGTGRYRFIHHEIPVLSGTDTVESVTQKLAMAIERAIRLYPEQWCWNYKRWTF